MQHKFFEGYFAVLIMVNSVWVGIELEYTRGSQPGSTVPVFVVVSYFFAVCFMAELGVRIVAEGGKFLCGQNYAWNLFDTFLVCSSLIEITIDLLAQHSD